MTEKIDFTEMYVTHDAFRRDLGRLEAAARAGRTDDPRVRGGWENFKAQLLVHHSVEDASLWPRLVPVATEPEAKGLLEDMETEHARIDPLLAGFDRALEDGADDLVVRAKELADVLGQHLEHEEEEALPLIQSLLTPADWKAFGRAMARRQGVRGAAAWVPWITDGMAPGDARAFLGRFPAPLRLLNRLLWAPRYERRRLWKF
ncbi:hemerythrin domain-containing protein [Actinomadura sp. DC4]|uniref:hemerythrin domain-containing protein n=1 Tax=Actinomadura sp. DC4 TaxID=3055069 RepID=UPI0025B16E36|nr:hemerythrin domain-containing protein [Actinomadura sp. DC4]MDN3354032.1 hemerythrin domain-containing protein [Actinomadura sp. DC4]